jgi:hypothetical protein
MPAWASWILKRLSHFAVYFILAAIIIWCFYRTAIHPLPTTTQTGGTSFNMQPKSYFGCTNWSIKKDQ